MINRISMFRTAKPNSPAFEAKGKIIYKYEKIPMDSFCKISDEFKDYPDLQLEIEKAQAELVDKLLAAGKIAKDGSGYVLKDKIKKVIIQPGDDDVPDDINLPDVEVEVTDVALDSIIAASVLLNKGAKVKDVNATYLSAKGISEITGTANVAKRIEMSNSSKARYIKASDFISSDFSQVTGLVDVPYVRMNDCSKVNDIKSKRIVLYGNSEITGTADISEQIIMNGSSKANNVNSDLAQISDKATSTGTISARILEVSDEAVANNVQADTLILHFNSKIEGTAEYKELNDHRSFWVRFNNLIKNKKG